MLLYQNNKRKLSIREMFSWITIIHIDVKIHRLKKTFVKFQKTRELRMEIYVYWYSSEVKSTFYCIPPQSCLSYPPSSSPPWHSSPAIVQPLAVSNRRGIDQCISQSAAWEQRSDWKSQSNNNNSFLVSKNLEFFSNMQLQVNLGLQMRVVNPDKGKNNRKSKLLHDFCKIQMLYFKIKSTGIHNWISFSINFEYINSFYNKNNT